MNYELLEYFTTDNISGKKCTDRWLSSNNNQLYNIIIKWCDQLEVLKELEFKRKVYHYINNLVEVPKCYCGNSVKYKRIKDGYSKYCSEICVKKSPAYYESWLNSWVRNNKNNKNFLSKRYDTIIKKWGTITNYKLHCLEVRKETNINRMGVDCLFLSEEFKNKRKHTLLEKYGDENWNNKEKTKNTRIKNGTQIDDSVITGIDYKTYKIIATNRTYTIYRNNENIINPLQLERGIRKYHIDHKFSLKQGFLENLPIEIITHPCNLGIIYWKDNLEKQDKCVISLFDLINDILNYKKDISIVHSNLNKVYQKEHISEICQSLLEKNNNKNHI